MTQKYLELIIGVLSILRFMCGIIAYEAQDYEGNFCKRQEIQCCEGRIDKCSVSISTTLCYCDQFCDRGTKHDDCCPDYKKICLGDEPTPIKCCSHKNQSFTILTGPIKDNCKNCTCDRAGVSKCDPYSCLVDEDLILNNNRSSGWVADNYTEYWGRKLSEGHALRLGTKQPHLKLLNISYALDAAKPLPGKFNAFDEWPGKITLIKDQGWRNTSWAISTSSVTSDRFRIHSKGKKNVDLSAQELLCQRRRSGDLVAAWQYLRKTGLVKEVCLPYTTKDQTCQIIPYDEFKFTNCSRRYKVGKPYSLFNETNIMSEIKKYGPVQATMKVYQDFFSYKAGIYRHAPQSSNDVFAYHSIRIVGWGEENVDQQLVKYWIAANSWGTWWGENGLFRILRGTNECDIEKYVVAALPVKCKKKQKNYCVPLYSETKSNLV